MYLYYCKDPNCPGHMKSWERCCDMRTFTSAQSAFRPMYAMQPVPATSRVRTPYYPLQRQNLI